MHMPRAAPNMTHNKGPPTFFGPRVDTPRRAGGVVVRDGGDAEAISQQLPPQIRGFQSEYD